MGFQSLNYPQHKVSVHELRCFLEELIASYPKITMSVIGTNLFLKDEEKESFIHQKWHSVEHSYEYQNVEDISTDFDALLTELMNDRKCKCCIIEFDVLFNMQCGDRLTSNHYQNARDEFIAKMVKTGQQKYLSSVS